MSDSSTFLIGASASVPERIIRNELKLLTASLEGDFSYVDGNPALRKVVCELWPDASSVTAKSNVSSRKAISEITHLILFWDGEDLSNLLLESRLQRKKTKLFAVQVTRVVNKNLTNEYDIYIGRGTPWGNPFAIGHGDGPDREEVIARYKQHFYEKIESDESFKRGIWAMKGLRLACFCKPQACHGDIIAEYLDGLPSDPPQDE